MSANVDADVNGEVAAVRALEREVYLDRPVDLLRVSTALCPSCPSCPTGPACTTHTAHTAH
ncbi:hypothetical protein HUT16_33470 [Kitasatospora sp. NA04385]|uniref:hypothetical protein n=1 Tax=Kitasatospora sp. NA04385 TaxID=2742135 RepID=UPI0015912453|nr:hypothetical protein [Kitasatospora sp. NA04385]QKW23347.1 hypothetical protein HUT16_33470 [Kitasatospora sp. NA04385]